MENKIRCRFRLIAAGKENIQLLFHNDQRIALPPEEQPKQVIFQMTLSLEGAEELYNALGNWVNYAKQNLPLIKQKDIPTNVIIFDPNRKKKKE
jgi:hypothetical protein